MPARTGESTVGHRGPKIPSPEPGLLSLRLKTRRNPFGQGVGGFGKVLTRRQVSATSMALHPTSAAVPLCILGQHLLDAAEVLHWPEDPNPSELVTRHGTALCVLRFCDL